MIVSVRILALSLAALFALAACGGAPATTPAQPPAETPAGPGDTPAPPADTPAPPATTPTQPPADTPAPPADTPAPPADTPAAGTPGPDPTPGGVTGDVCALISAEEMSEIMGVTMLLQPIDAEETGTCTFAAQGMGIPAVTLRFEGGDLTVPRMLFGESAQDVTIGGRPAVMGMLFGIIAYIQLDSQQMFVVQSVLTEDTPQVRQQVQSIGETVIQRIP
jgi:hypothetical protein